MADRVTVDVTTPPDGWLAPWPNVAEIASVLPPEKWSLIGGLMVQPTERGGVSAQYGRPTMSTGSSTSRRPVASQQRRPERPSHSATSCSRRSIRGLIAPTDSPRSRRCRRHECGREGGRPGGRPLRAARAGNAERQVNGAGRGWDAGASSHDQRAAVHHEQRQHHRQCAKPVRCSRPQGGPTRPTAADRNDTCTTPQSFSVASRTRTPNARTSPARTDAGWPPRSGPSPTTI